VEFPLYIQPSVQYRVTALTLWQNERNQPSVMLMQLQCWWFDYY